MIEVGLEVEALQVALLNAAFFFGLQVHLVVAFDTLARTGCHHGGEILKHDTRLHILSEVALLRLVRLHFRFLTAILI